VVREGIHKDWTDRNTFQIWTSFSQEHVIFKCTFRPSSSATANRYYTMPSKEIQTPYPLIDADPHASRVVRYFRPSDYAWWLGATSAFPAALYFWGTFLWVISVPHSHVCVEMADPTKTKMRVPLRLGGFLGFVGGFLFAYQRSSGLFRINSLLQSSLLCHRQHVSGVGQRISARLNETLKS
jgi:hypothetical protein